MNKEEILEGLKELILALRDEGEHLRTDELYRKEWQRKQKAVSEACETLNSCDALWVNDEYGKWYRKEIQPVLDNIDPEIKKRFNLK